MILRAFFIIHFLTTASLAFAVGDSTPVCTTQPAPLKCMRMTPAQTLKANACEAELKAADCAAFAKAHPNLVQEGKLKNCDVIATCPNPPTVKDYLKACAVNAGGAWKDAAVGLVNFLFTAAPLPPDILAREKFFADCSSVECKYQMLGPLAVLFSKEEIEGHPERKDLDPRDPVNQNYLQGFTSKVLYRLMLERLRAQISQKTIDETLIQPWTGKVKGPKPKSRSMNEMIDAALASMGLTHRECYNPLVLFEMRCYAAFTVIDPLLLYGATVKVARLAGMALKIGSAAKSAELSAEAAAKSGAEGLSKVADLEVLPALDKSNPQIQIWQLREAGQTQKADALERELTQKLSNAKIGDKPLHVYTKGDSRPMLVELEDGTQAIWKPFEEAGAHGDHEIAVYDVDRYLELGQVPTMVEREYKGHRGTLQVFVRGAEKVALKDDPVETSLFDKVIGNADRTDQNYLLVGNRYVLIDHGLSFVTDDYLSIKAQKLFSGAVDSKITDYLAERETTKLLEKDLAKAQAGHANPQRVEQLSSALNRQRTLEALVRSKAMSELAQIFFKEKSYNILKNTTDAQWKALLEKRLSPKEIADFLRRKNEAITKVEEAIRVFGQDVLPGGPFSRLTNAVPAAAGTTAHTVAIPMSVDETQLTPEQYQEYVRKLHEAYLKANDTP